MVDESRSSVEQGVNEEPHRYVLAFQEIDQKQIALVGGKGACLGELSRIDGIRVPAGFCVTTHCFQQMLARAPSIDEHLDRLSRLNPDDGEAILSLTFEIRRIIEATDIPVEVETAIIKALGGLGTESPCAVRSSATAEDMPTASFAGQLDTYLNVVGPSAILGHISRCWASVFTARAATYCLRNGFEHRKIHMAVVVQQMVFPQSAGIVFTADPMTFNRKVTAVEACFGLGQALVSGLVNPDIYKVRDGEIISRAIAAKQRATFALRGGGTQDRAIEPEHQRQPALTDAQVVALAQIGRRLELHFDQPQDIEWCLVEGQGLSVLQSRPITTLYPIPVVGDEENHVFVSVGHAQMMTDAMKPLGISMWQLTTPRPMKEAGGRLFVDVTKELGSPRTRAGLLETFCRSDPLTGDAMRTVVQRDDFIPTLPDQTPAAAPTGEAPAPIPTDPAIVSDLIDHNQDSLAALKRDIRTKSGSALFDFIMADIQELKRILFDPHSHQVFMTAMEATWWLNENLQNWLGEQNAADTLTRSVSHNITSEMGLALLDVADTIRPHTDVVDFLRHVDNEGFLDELPRLEGGNQARQALKTFLEKYGMRCTGEIDITRPRWNERPTTLLPVLLSNIENFEPDAGAQIFEQGQREAWEKERELLERLRFLPDGERKAQEVKQMIDRVRTFIGYREYPKYGMVSRYSLYKQALLREADRLVQAGLLSDAGDIFYLTFQELREVVRTNRVDASLISSRKIAFESYRTLTPPRVLTSEGESINGTYRRDDLPSGALVGLPVSSGTIEGRARVVLDMAGADLNAGDILVTTYTDPSWTPLFVAIKGLVTEVGGLMTHGAVIAREYGLPAVVGVEQATRLIRDGQLIRVDGTNGYVEILTDGSMDRFGS
jgi:rifampicin phosphotransferase